MTVTYENLEAIVKGKGYKWFTEPGKLNLIGIRTNLIVPNVYNDIMCIAYIDAKGVKKAFNYAQTTLPGKFWLNNPMNPKGAGILRPGQYTSWVKGTHGKTRPHDALIQIGGPVNIWRDNDKDDIAEFEGKGVTKEDNVYIGLNIHASWAKGDRAFIDKDSAACQVSFNSWNHEQMMALVDAYIISQLGYLPTNKAIMENPKLQVKFTYTLLEEKDLK